MRNSVFIVALLVGMTGAGTARAQGRYVLEKQSKKGGYGKVTISLRDTKRDQVLWTERVFAPFPLWTKDRRAVAIANGNIGLLVWREGEGLRRFGVPAGRDYLMGCVWSPDKRRILVRCGSSGAGDMDAGSLFCLRLDRGKKYKITPVAPLVRDMKWRSARTALYRVLGDDMRQVSGWKRWPVRMEQSKIKLNYR